MHDDIAGVSKTLQKHLAGQGEDDFLDVVALLRQVHPGREGQARLISQVRIGGLDDAVDDLLVGQPYVQLGDLGQVEGAGDRGIALGAHVPVAVELLLDVVKECFRLDRRSEHEHVEPPHVRKCIQARDLWRGGQHHHTGVLETGLGDQLQQRVVGRQAVLVDGDGDKGERGAVEKRAQVLDIIGGEDVMRGAQCLVDHLLHVAGGLGCAYDGEGGARQHLDHQPHQLPDRRQGEDQ